MDTKKIFIVLLLFIGFNSCRNFDSEKIVINYKEGYIKVLSNEYVIDSLVMYNNGKRYYLIGLNDKKTGSNIIFYKIQNPKYKIYIDSLNYFCSNSSETDAQELEVVIRKKGYIGKVNGKDYLEIQYSGYNKIPCKSATIDTIETSSPYK